MEARDDGGGKPRLRRAPVNEASEGGARGCGDAVVSLVAPTALEGALQGVRGEGGRDAEVAEPRRPARVHVLRQSLEEREEERHVTTREQAPAVPRVARHEVAQVQHRED